MRGFANFNEAAQDIVSARVVGIIDRVSPEVFDQFSPVQSDQVVFSATITRGARRGEQIIASQQSFMGIGFAIPSEREVAPGDSILLVSNYEEEEWFFYGFTRINSVIVLAVLFVLSILLLGGKKGFNTILSLGLTCAAIFIVFIPSIVSGKNIYILSMLVCAYTVIMTLAIVVGINKKSFIAAAGCLCGILASGIITLIMDVILRLTGVIDEHSIYLINLPIATSINLRGVIFAGIIIGAMGAIMDVAMSMASALWEIRERSKDITFEEMIRSGLTIGRDIMGTMANTLILAYIGSSLAVVLVMSVYTTGSSLLGLFNSERIIVEILQALIGSFGILLTIPLTTLLCAIFYLRDSRK
jgi:uncharacterized membrane protein